MIYFDNAATTLQKPLSVSAAIRSALSSCGGAGRGGHKPSMRAAAVLYECRETAASLLNVQDPERIVFTLNATHALNIAISQFTTHGARVLVSGYEHNAVMRPLEAKKSAGVQVTPVLSSLFAPDEALSAWQKALEKPVDLVVCSHVSNVFGNVMPIAEIAALCADKGVPLVVDAAQSAGTVPIDVDACAPAYWCMPGHKGLYGPQGTGLLICPEGHQPAPVLYGGTGSNSALMEMPDFLPDRLEAGTHNIHGIAGLMAGLRFVQAQGVQNLLHHEQALLTRCAEALIDLGYICYCSGAYPKAVKTAKTARRVGFGTQPAVAVSNEPPVQTGVLSFRREGVDSEEIAELLSEKGVYVRAGLHCAPLAHKTAGTFPDGTVRLSFSAFNTQREVERFISIMKSLTVDLLTRA